MAMKAGDSKPLKRRDIALLLDLLERITAGRTVEDICRAVVEGMRQDLGFERAGLFLWDENVHSFRGTFGTDLQGRTTIEHHLVMACTPDSPEERIRRGSALERNCRPGQPLPRPGEEDITADMIALRRGQETYGLLCVDNRISRGPISEADLQFVKLIGQVLGNELEAARAREALARSEERFRQVSENSREWIWETDAQGRYVFCSPVIETILGYTPDEATGRRPAQLAATEEQARVEEQFRMALDRAEALQGLLYRARRKDGAFAVLETSALPVPGPDGRAAGLRGAHRDVTRERDLQHQLRYSQKMEAVGRLAGGVAHDFNNLLTGILGCASIVSDGLRPEDPLQDDLRKIRAAGERAAQLTGHLLSFSHPQAERLVPLSLNQVVQDVEPLFRRMLGEEIELAFLLEPDLPRIRGDEDQLRQILIQLAVNARDAMIHPDFLARSSLSPERRQALFEAARARPPVLTVRTARIQLDDEFCRLRPPLRPGACLELRVSDTGIGLPPEAREHLFEPFFTTREVGGGSGLGLSTLYGIVQHMGGWVEAESEAGQGTTFHLYFPFHKAPGPVKATPESPAGPRTILLVEDNDIVRGLTYRLLKDMGHDVLQAHDGLSALELARDHPAPIHLVVTDMVMPRMDGKHLVEALRQHRNDFKVLFISGYHLTESVGGRVLGVEVPLLQKPFTKDELAGKVREVLDGA